MGDIGCTYGVKTILALGGIYIKTIFCGEDMKAQSKKVCIIL